MVITAKRGQGSSRYGSGSQASDDLLDRLGFPFRRVYADGNEQSLYVVFGQLADDLAKAAQDCFGVCGVVSRE
jgi:hypothetical protein